MVSNMPRLKSGLYHIKKKVTLAGITIYVMSKWAKVLKMKEYKLKASEISNSI